jgi:hypothetical protein
MKKQYIAIIILAVIAAVVIGYSQTQNKDTKIITDSNHQVTNNNINAPVSTNENNSNLADKKIIGKELIDLTGIPVQYQPESVAVDIDQLADQNIINNTSELVSESGKFSVRGESAEETDHITKDGVSDNRMVTISSKGFGVATINISKLNTSLDNYILLNQPGGKVDRYFKYVGGNSNGYLLYQNNVVDGWTTDGKYLYRFRGEPVASVNGLTDAEAQKMENNLPKYIFTVISTFRFLK